MITNKDRNLVLVFNNMKRLIAVFHSQCAAAVALNVNIASISYACTGRCISVNNLYLRTVPEGFCLSLEGLGFMNLLKFDELFSVKRKVYATKEMSRKGMKYKKN